MEEQVSSEANNRRRSPRIRAAHDLVLHIFEGEGFKATSVDLNLGGIYCSLDRYVPLFEKMQIAMSLPLTNEDGDEHVFPVEFEGVVVRMEPDEPQPGTDSYACAMAFVNVTAEAELILAKYLLGTLGG